MPTKQLEGIHFVRSSELTKAGNRKRRKPTLEELIKRSEVLSRSQTASDEIRAKDRTWRIPQRPADNIGPTRALDVIAAIDWADRNAKQGLDPLPPNFYRQAFAAELRAREGSTPKPRKRPAKRRPVSAPKRPKRSRAGNPPSGNLLRLYRAELEAMGTAEARAELKRREDKRAAKRAAKAPA